MASNTISMKMRNLFGVADFGLSTLTAAMQFYMLFYYTDVVKIDPGIAGTAMLAGKLTWDLINDVLCGYISDRTRSRWGRRRPYLIFMAIPLGLSFGLLFSLPTGMSNGVAFIAILASFLLFDTFNTFISTAYSSMTAELTLDYNERTRLTTVRMVYNSVGYIFGAAITTMLAGWIKSGMGVDDQAAWSLLGFIFGGLAAITVLVTGLGVTMKPVVTPTPQSLPPLRAVFSTFTNKPFVSFVVIQAFMAVAFTFVTTMLPYFLIYQMLMADQISLVMMAMLVVLTLFLVPCKILAERVGKAKAYAIGLSVACAALLAGFFLPQSAAMAVYGVAIVAGIGFSSQWVCPHSMIPDVIEYDELKTGERREGLYYGMYATTTKITNALGIALCGWGLKLFGYVEGVEQTVTALWGIRIMFAAVPILFLMVTVPLLLKYPITRESHARVLEQIQARRANAAAEAK